LSDLLTKASKLVSPGESSSKLLER
jgi:hypothetical protein